VSADPALAGTLRMEEAATWRRSTRSTPADQLGEGGPDRDRRRSPATSLAAVVEAARLGLIEPILVGPHPGSGGRRAASLGPVGVPASDSSFSHESAARALGLCGAGRREVRCEGQPPHRRVDGGGRQARHRTRMARARHCLSWTSPVTRNRSSSPTPR
jgi:hypothetical protein